jgi:hypothetical protein
MTKLLLLIFVFSSVSWAANEYTLQDLEVLAKEGSAQEFFAHALDIRPSERQENWKSLVSKMGDDFARKVLENSEIKKKDFLKIEELFNWPSLKSDDVFKVRRQEIGIRYLKKCLKENLSCWEDFKSFWEKDKENPEISFKLAEISLKNEASPLSTWNLLEAPLKSPLSEFYCKKDFVMNALWGKIELDYIKLGSEGDLLKKIDQTVHPDCLPSLIAEAKKRLLKPPRIQDREVAYQILKSQSKADEALTDFFYTVYLLDNPAQGELFNYSWNRVRELGGTITRREKVLKKLRDLDPLPDELLSTLDETKKRVVLKHFRTYFPEYLDFYADQCIKFYSGKGVFPLGNPTIHCQKLMTSDLAPLVLDDFKIKQFQEAQKI